MRLIVLPDLHTNLALLDAIATEVRAADLVILPGDLTNNGDTAQVQAVVDGVRRYNHRILAIPGNWDGPAVAEFLDRERLNLDRRHVIIDGVAFAGVGAALPALARSPNERSEAELAAALAAAVAGLDPAVPLVLVCHQPPLNTAVDRTWTELHVGSKAVRSWIEKHQPLVCLSGHIHEAVDIDTLGRTKLLNPGPLWMNRYGVVEIDGDAVTVEVRSI